jgi:serine/threonine protein kinase
VIQDNKKRVYLNLFASSTKPIMAPSVEGFHPENIPSIVTGLRNDGTAASFCLGTDHTLSGKECVIYAVQFPDAATWAVRVPVHASHLPPESISNFVETEVSILKRLQTSGFSKSPKLLGYNSGFDNPIGFPYLVLSWFEGTPLEWSDTVPPQRERRNKIIRQMVDIILELADCTKEWRRNSAHSFEASCLPILIGTRTSASKYLIKIIDRKIVRASHGQMPELQLRDCFIQRALASRVVHPALETPFLISHEDLAPQNIIVDSENNIKGYIFLFVQI